jgi:hypothetical protein
MIYIFFTPHYATSPFYFQGWGINAKYLTDTHRRTILILYLTNFYKFLFYLTNKYPFSHPAAGSPCG